MNTMTEAEDSLHKTLETLMVYFPYDATLGCLVIFLNSLILYFYHKQYRKFVPCMYLLLALFDCLMIIFMIISCCLVSKFEGKSSEYILKNKWVIIGFKYGEKWSLRMSIFINTLLSVARTLKTVRPFSEIKMKTALLSVVLYEAYWSVFVSLDILSIANKDNGDNSKDHNITPEETFRRAIIDERVGGETFRLFSFRNKSVAFLFINFIPYALPVMVCLVSGTIMIVYLRKEPPNQQSAIAQRHVSITVLLLTVSFVLCLSVPVLYDLARRISGEVHDSSKGTNLINIGNYKHILESTVPLVNALLSPAIMIWRSSELRGKLREIFRKFRTSRTTENLEMEQF